MYDQLQVFLDIATTPERKLLLVRADEVLKALGVASHEDLLIETMERLDVEEVGTSVNDIEGIYRQSLTEALAQFDVWPSSECSLMVLSEVVGMLSVIDSYEDPDSLLSIIEGGDDAVVILATLTAELSTLDVTDVLFGIDHVGGRLISRMREVITGEEDMDEVAVVRDLREIRRRVAYLIERKPYLLVKKGIENDLSLETPFHHWVESFREEVENLLPSKMVENLLAFAVASGANETEAHELASGELETLLHDPLDITKADIQLSKLVSEVFS